MRLAELAASCECRLRGPENLQATGISHRSSGIRPGMVFAALPGLRRHGIEFVAEALELGAAVVLSDRDPGPEVPWLASSTPRRSTALAAWSLAGNPEQRITMVGITGTNGKSTVADLAARIAAAAGERTGVFGTLGHTLPGREIPPGHTTPEAPDLAPLLAELVESGGTTAIMEVSSHALSLDRVAGLPLDVGVWTNLTRDHLDFHQNMDEYFAAKRSMTDLLRQEPAGRRVVGADDPNIARLLDDPHPGDISFGLDGTRDVTADGLHFTSRGTTFTLVAPGMTATVTLPLVGRHNVRNALAAAGIAAVLGWPAEAVVAGLASARPLPGRLEPVEAGTRFPVLVDYAHTPDALEQVLTALRDVGEHRLIVVFGCGGDRDPGKRAPMGEIVGRLADVPIVTSDNPRSEDPESIIAQVMEGVRVSGNQRALAIPDRREAIGAALAMADERCLVLVAGKGHEGRQIFKDRIVEFDDRQVVRELARGRRR